MKVDTQQLLTFGAIGVGGYFLYQQFFSNGNSGDNENNNSGGCNFQVTGNVTAPNGTVLPATQCQGMTYVLMGGQWVLLSAIQQAEAIQQQQQQQGQGSQQNSGPNIWETLLNNSGQIADILKDIFGSQSNNQDTNNGNGLPPFTL